MLNRALCTTANGTDSVWTKRECPRTSDRGDKPWKTLEAFTTPCPHSFTLCPHSAVKPTEEADNACGAIITIF